ncbi:putative ribonuclease H-like domain-containing protein [Tanacetum coccineum]|uniref:Ribonuclease H-like domain-containing protein n=1 Tax=Tanacetum coccineum TaxID=301880 RepID=A0ABQ5C134_9ASTR
MPELEDIVYSDDYEDVGVEADMNNLNTFMPVSPIPTTRIHNDHPVEQIIGDLNSAPKTRRITKSLEEHGLFSSVQQRTNHKDFQNCLFACFLSQEEPKKTLVDLPNRKRAIGTKWVLRNKKDERGIVIKNKERLVAQGYTQEEGVDYDEVFAPVARIEAIRLFLAYASFKDFKMIGADVLLLSPDGCREVERMLWFHCLGFFIVDCLHLSGRIRVGVSGDFVGYLFIIRWDLERLEVPRVLVTCRSKLKFLKTVKTIISGTDREALFRQSVWDLGVKKRK